MDRMKCRLQFPSRVGLLTTTRVIKIAILEYCFGISVIRQIALREPRFRASRRQGRMLLEDSLKLMSEMRFRRKTN